MRRPPAIAVLIAAFITPAAGALGWTTVGSGIGYQEFQLPDPNNVYVARMERNHADCTIESSIGQGRLSGGTERMSSQASRYDNALSYWHQDWGRRNDVVVAVNGDFWNTGTGVPLGGQIHSGWFAKSYTAGAFAWSVDRVPFIASGTYLTQVVVYTGTGISQTCDGINRSRGTDELILYTPQYDSDTNTDSAGTEVLVELGRPAMVLSSGDPAVGRVEQIRQNQGSTPIPFDHVVLSATASAATTLLANVALGDEITLAQNRSNPAPWTRAYASVGGGEVFLLNGVVLGGQAVRHPRTAAAYNEDYVFFVVVDGRSGVSVGMTMQELGVFCRDYLDALAGINLDGGGSSTMVVNGTVKNDPSDGSERYVANGLMMVALQPKTHSASFNTGDQIKTTGNANVRLGPGTNYAVLTTASNNTQGVIVDHSLLGVRAKGYYWWKCEFGNTVGWVAESLLTPVSAGNGPVISVHPADQEVCASETAVFSLTASGTEPVTYSWQKDGVDLGDDGHYSGTGTPALAILNVADADRGSYRCVVTDANGTATSHSAALLPPRPLTTITQHPTAQETPPVHHGLDVTFTMTATGDGALTYRWEKDGDDLTDSAHISGTTTPTLLILDVDRRDEGNYRCRVTGGCGTVHSNEAPLKVIAADFDRDNDVDQTDFGYLQTCLCDVIAWPCVPECADAMLDGDSDVDSDDVSLFWQCLSGADVPFDPDCLD